MLLSGEDEFFAKKALKEHKKMAIKADPNFTFVDLDAKAYTPGDIFTLSSPSLFSQSENIFLFINNLQNATEVFYEDYIRWISSIGDTSHLNNDGASHLNCLNALNFFAVFWHQKGTGGRKIINSLKQQKNFKEVPCKSLTAGNTIPFIHSYSREVDFNISAQTAEYIAGSLGQNASVIAGFIDHMSFLVHMKQYQMHNTAQKTYSIVSSYLEHDSGAGVYKISNAVLNLKKSKALTLTRKYIDSGQNLILLQTILMIEFVKLAKTTRGNHLWPDEKITKSILLLAELDLLLKGKTKATKFAVERTLQKILTE